MFFFFCDIKICFENWDILLVSTKDILVFCHRVHKWVQSNTQNHIQEQVTYDSSVLNAAEQMNVADVVL